MNTADSGAGARVAAGYPLDEDLVALAALGHDCALWPDERVSQVLGRIDYALCGLAGALEVEYYGPEVGLGTGHAVYRMVVRRHHLGANMDAWGLWICTALPHAQWRPAWRLPDAGRLRKQQVVKALPAFFQGYAEAVQDAGKAGTNAGRRLLALARMVATAAPVHGTPPE
ncbi:MAG: hypothetical protein ACYCP0_01615 [Acidiferrobacteraceae bacterium]